MAAIDAQDQNYLVHLENDVHAFLDAFLALQDRVTEAYDRGVNLRVPDYDYPLPGELSHIDPQRLANFLVGYAAVDAAMEANDRAVFTNFYALVR